MYDVSQVYHTLQTTVKNVRRQRHQLLCRTTFESLLVKTVHERDLNPSILIILVLLSTSHYIRVNSRKAISSVSKVFIT